MGFGSVAPSAYCRAPLWAAPPSSAWFAAHHLVTVPAMNDISEFCKSPKSTQSDTDCSISSTEGRVGNSMPTLPTVNKVDPNVPTRCMWKGCGKAFSQLDNLSAHVAAEHATVQAGLFYCGWEGCLRGHRGFNARYKMLVHVRTHTKERPHSCLVCGKSFSRAENLKIHARSHSGEKPYVCTVPGCGKAYSNSSDRFKHTRTHMVEKPYCCKIPGCQKRYTDPSSLRKHVKTFKHTNIEVTDNKVEVNNAVSNKNNIQENANQFYSNFEKLVTIANNKNMSESDEYERIKGQYTYPENDCFLPENVFRFNIGSTQTNFSFENAPSYLSKIHQDDITNDLCFCKDLPCIHTSRYVQPEFIRVSPLTYDKIQINPIFEPPIKESTKYVEEPLNLKRKYFDDELLGLEKKSKTEFRNIIVDDCIEAPLDLSSKKCH